MAATTSTCCRSYVVVVHQKYGVLLLQTPPLEETVARFELPGGFIQQIDHDECHASLRLAGRNSAARHLFEQTNLDFRDVDKLRLEFLDGCEKSQVFFFVLKLSDVDIPFLDEHYRNTPATDLLLKLSERHTGFIFVKDLLAATVLLGAHADGKSSSALRKYGGATRRFPSACCLWCVR